MAPALIVTCAHVAHRARPLWVEWGDREADVPANAIAAVPPLDSVENWKNYPLPDLALASVGEAETWDHPCVLLGTAPPALESDVDDLYLAAYTSEEHADDGTVKLSGTTTSFESLVISNGHRLLKVKRGLIKGGVSGSPLLDRSTGTVTGVMESTRDTRVGEGGYAVPAATLAETFPQAAEKNREFHDRDRRWRDALEAERVQKATRAGRRRKLPLEKPVVALPPDSDPSPAEVLHPRHAVVSFVGREETRDRLAAWRTDIPGDDRPFQVAFMTGGGGFGKTRLAIEVCREAEALGWTVGLLSPTASDGELDELAAWPGKLLIAIDYAESRSDQLARLARKLANRDTDAAVRLLLLVRRNGSKPELLEPFRQLSDLELMTRLRGAPIYRLEDGTGQQEAEVDRIVLFRQATQDLARIPGLTAPQGGRNDPNLDADHFRRPLDVLVAAYLSLSSGANVAALSETELLLSLLEEHENNYWARHSLEQNLGLHRDDQSTAVALATLMTAEGDAEALAVARLIPGYEGASEDRLRSIARWLAGLYAEPSGDRVLRIAPLEPDRLGEVLVAKELALDPHLLMNALVVAKDRQLVRVLTVVARIVADDEVVRGQLSAARSVLATLSRTRQLNSASLLRPLADISNLFLGTRDYAAAFAAERMETTILHELAKEEPERYAPALGASLSLVAHLASRVEEAPQPEELFAEILQDMPARGSHHVIFARGSWRAREGQVPGAVDDLAAALREFDRRVDQASVGEVRRELRALRERKASPFDQAWRETGEPLPVWLRYLADDPNSNALLQRWPDAADRAASRDFLQTNADVLLTDQAEAALEHLIDASPHDESLEARLEILRYARAQGIDYSYSYLHPRLTRWGLAQLLTKWTLAENIATSWEFAMDHARDLLELASWQVLQVTADGQPADPRYRFHRAVLTCAMGVGFEEAYVLAEDATTLRLAAANPALQVSVRLNAARMSGGPRGDRDDYEGNFRLALLALLDIPADSDMASAEAWVSATAARPGELATEGAPEPDRGSRMLPDIATARTVEACAALMDCAIHALPGQRQDYRGQLADLAADHPHLAEVINYLKQVVDPN